MATFSLTPCSHLPPHGPQCRWGWRLTPTVRPFGGQLGAGCGASFRGEWSPELGRKRLTGQRWDSCFGRARKCGHAMVQHPESFPMSSGEHWPISQPSGAPRPGCSPRQALTAASRNRPLNASSLPDHHHCCVIPPPPAVPGGQRLHLSWGSMQGPRYSRDRSEPLWPLPRQGNLAAGLSLRSLVSATWNLSD